MSASSFSELIGLTYEAFLPGMHVHIGILSWVRVLVVVPLCEVLAKAIVDFKFLFYCAVFKGTFFGTFSTMHRK
jgi:hypothetical protein